MLEQVAVLKEYAKDGNSKWREEATNSLVKLHILSVEVSQEDFERILVANGMTKGEYEGLVLKCENYVNFYMNPVRDASVPQTP